MIRNALFTVLFLALAACSRQVDHQAEAATLAGPNCAIPSNIDRPDVEIPGEDGAVQVPVKGFTLALSWSPQYCRDHGGSAANVSQCVTSQPFGFILHGLWPEGEGREHPAWCAPAEPLTLNQVRANFCMMPSAQLQQHEWAKHGTCHWRNAEAFFAAASKAFRAIKTPDMDALSRQGTTMDAFRDVIARLNPGLPPAAVNVRTTHGNWLSEVQICYDLVMKPAACSRPVRGRPEQRLKIWRAVK